MHSVIIFPNTLFQNNALVKKGTTVYILEHKYYFTKYNYHKTKLMLHRASMKRYSQYIKDRYNVSVKYINFKDCDSMLISIFCKSTSVAAHDPIHHGIVNQLKKLAKIHNTDLTVHESLLFIETTKDLREYIKNTNNYKNHSFYLWQRKRLNILMDGDKPIGNQWSYDKENRKPFPRDFKEIPVKNIDNKYIREASTYVENNFSNNFGIINSYLPIDFESCKRYFKNFLLNKLSGFGPYEDAVNSTVIFGNHSAISPLLNIGLLTPKYVIDCVLKMYYAKKVAIESVEGFIRQIIGWRSHIRMIYYFKHNQLVKGNYFNHTRKLKRLWYNAKTKIKPIDHVINKIQQYGYAHHIERLMYIGNFMLLCNIKPTDCFKFFMTTVDCYDWVMMPNIYGMSQYSAGNLMMTRPYFSSSNYIFKLSDYKKNDPDDEKIVLNCGNFYWYEIWDALYYNFVNKNMKTLKQNYSTVHAVSNWNRKSSTDQKKYIQIAKEYLRKY